MGWGFGSGRALAGGVGVDGADGRLQTSTTTAIISVTTTTTTATTTPTRNSKLAAQHDIYKCLVLYIYYADTQSYSRDAK